ncbi:MAG: hypothetical protein ALAOOOJD_04633 [bacterium]|nr:hypothetical protein [bacterium]
MKFHRAVIPVLCALVAMSDRPVLSQNSPSNSESSTTLSSNQAAAVTADQPRRSAPRFYQDLYEGARMSFGLGDLAGITVAAILDQQQPAQGLKLAPLAVDHEISESLARDDGKKSLGAISPLYYPGATATVRLAGMAMIDAVGIHDYSAVTYARMFRFQQALYYTKVVTHLAKRNIQRYRPDGSDTYSFFSGHTSTAFATSTFLYLEARDFIDGLAQSRGGQLPLLSPRGWKLVSFGALYGWAGYVGFSRIHDKKHYLSDVLVGAASGTLVSYLVYPHSAKNHGMQLGLQPMRSGAGLALGIKF